MVLVLGQIQLWPKYQSMNDRDGRGIGLKEDTLKRTEHGGQKIHRNKIARIQYHMSLKVDLQTLQDAVEAPTHNIVVREGHAGPNGDHFHHAPRMLNTTAVIMGYIMCLIARQEVT